MISQRIAKVTFVTLGIGLAAAFASYTLGPLEAEAKGKGKDKGKVDTAFDVACDANSFRFEGPTTPAGPDGGASFVVEGVIYPGGTFDDNGSGSGLNPDGTAEFPDLVIGRWYCRGWFVNEGIATPSGVFVVTTQIYDVGDEPGQTTMVSDGIELIDLNLPFERAITGGTGQYARGDGVVIQEAVGANSTGLFNFTFDFGKRRGPLPMP